MRCSPDRMAPTTCATIIAGAGEWLSADGVVVCELSPEQAESMRAFASERFAEVEVHPDLAGRDRALVAATSDQLTLCPVRSG